MRQNKRVILNENPLGKFQGIFYLERFLPVIFLMFSFSLMSQPRLEVKDAKKNFGHVKRGEKITLEYEILNTGDAPLIVSDFEVACSCTDAAIPKQPVMPGGSARVIVTLSTKSVYGRQDRIVSLFSNDPESPHKLRFKGTVSKN